MMHCFKIVSGCAVLAFVAAVAGIHLALMYGGDHLISF
jgi:hypothetical protein